MQLRFQPLVSVRASVLLAGAICGLAGCRGGGGTPVIAASSAATEAIAAYDANGDGALEGKELDACPALHSLAAKLKKTKLVSEDISARLDTYNASEARRLTLSCAVYLDGAPLDGATVTFKPEKFLGSAYKPARGVSHNGEVEPVTEGDSIGLALGMYRVEVSKLDGAGNETIPAKYNSETILGCEISPETGSRGDTPPLFKLSRK